MALTGLHTNWNNENKTIKRQTLECVNNKKDAQ
jgi:hypothetical protein